MKNYCCALDNWFFPHFFRSESPSSQRSSPPISPGCEDQILDLPPHLQDPFKKPMPPFRQQDFQHFYSGYPYHLIQHGGSAFHRPIDASGKPIPVSIVTLYTSAIRFHLNFIKFSLLKIHMTHGFVPPHLSLEILAKAGMFHPQLPNLAGKTQTNTHLIRANVYFCLI